MPVIALPLPLQFILYTLAVAKTLYGLQIAFR
jgi:hypothetical protein